MSVDQTRTIIKRGKDYLYDKATRRTEAMSNMNDETPIAQALAAPLDMATVRKDLHLNAIRILAWTEALDTDWDSPAAGAICSYLDALVDLQWRILGEPANEAARLHAEMAAADAREIERPRPATWRVVEATLHPKKSRKSTAISKICGGNHAFVLAIRSPKGATNANAKSASFFQR